MTSISMSGCSQGLAKVIGDRLVNLESREWRTSMMEKSSQQLRTVRATVETSHALYLAMLLLQQRNQFNWETPAVTVLPGEGGCNKS